MEKKSEWRLNVTGDPDMVHHILFSMNDAYAKEWRDHGGFNDTGEESRTWCATFRIDSFQKLMKLLAVFYDPDRQACINGVDDLILWGTNNEDAGFFEVGLFCDGRQHKILSNVELSHEHKHANILRAAIEARDTLVDALKQDDLGGAS